MAPRLHENFEVAVGYDLGATAVGGEGPWYAPPFAVDGGSVCDPDALSSDVSTPPGWGTQCMKIVHVASTNAVQRLLPYGTVIGPPPKLRQIIAFECVFTSFSGVDGQLGSIVQAIATAVNPTWRVTTSQTGGVASLQIDVNPDGAGLVTKWSEPLVLNKLYRFEILWDAAAAVWNAKIDGRIIATAVLSSTALGVTILRFNFGTTSASGNAFTVYIDRIAVDDTIPINDRSTRSLAGSQRAT